MSFTLQWPLYPNFHLLPGFIPPVNCEECQTGRNLVPVIHPPASLAFPCRQSCIWALWMMICGPGPRLGLHWHQRRAARKSPSSPPWFMPLAALLLHLTRILILCRSSLQIVSFCCPVDNNKRRELISNRRAPQRPIRCLINDMTYWAHFPFLPFFQTCCCILYFNLRLTLTLLYSPAHRLPLYHRRRGTNM